MPVGCSFQETLLCGTLPISLWPRSHRLGGANPSGYTLTVSTGYKFSNTHFFRRESLLALLSVKHAASCAAFKMVRCNVYTILVCFSSSSLFLLLMARGWDTFQHLVCSFVLGILVQIIHSATPVWFTCLRCILHVRLCCSALCVTCSVVRVLEYFILSAHLLLN